MSLVEWFWYSLIFIAGLALGSYLNSWAWRHHEGRWQFSLRSVIAGKVRPSTVVRIGFRSICIHCQRVLAWFENIPLGSFLALRGRCRTCREPIPLDYFFVELATAVLFVGVAFIHTHLPAFNPWHFFRDLFFSALLIVIFVYDLKYYIIVPSLTLTGAVIAFALNYQLSAPSFQSSIIGIAVGSGFFLVQYMVSRGHWIGKGDIYLGVLMGALLGFPAILVALFVAYIFGALAAIPLLLSKKKTMHSEVPFGTFLAIGTVVALLWGEPIVRSYTALVKL